MPNISPTTSTILFADDTTLLFRNNSFDNLIHSCNYELDKFRDWTISNRLSLNTEKTHILLVSNRKIPYSPSISYGNQLLQIKNSCKFLGIIIDDKLKFHLQTQHICNKISKSAGILFKLKNFAPPRVLKNIYYTLVYPYIIYCNLSWGHTFISSLQPIIITQKRIVRTLSNASFYAHTNPLFHEQSILKLLDLIKYRTTIFMYKNIDQFSTPNFHTYNTRNNSSLRPTYRRTTLTQHSLSFIGPNTWNNLPLIIKSSPSLEIFKRKVKNFILSTYSD